MGRAAFLPTLSILCLCAACGSCDRLESSSGPAPDFGPAEGVPTIRVALRRNAESVTLAIEGPYTITDGDASRMLSQGAFLARDEVTYKSGKFSLTPIRTRHLIITPKINGSIVVGDKHYRGVLHLWGAREKDKDGKYTPLDRLSAVNHVNLEHYLASVVPAEMKMSWPEAALQAQAVAARTYALWRMEQVAKGNRTWDLTSGADSQVYAGLDRETEKSRKIIIDTAGTVLLFKDLNDKEPSIFPAYYHSTCGGDTADAHVVFGGREMPCLTRVTCAYCTDSPVYEWTFALSQNDLAEIIMKAGGKDIGKIVEIECIGPEAAQRPRQVILKGSELQVRFSIGDFRRAVGTRRMKSSFFTIEKTGDYFKITGHGWGHGVGMCQWGAAGMAAEPFCFSAQEILQHYYQGAQLQRLY